MPTMIFDANSLAAYLHIKGILSEQIIWKRVQLFFWVDNSLTFYLDKSILSREGKIDREDYFCLSQLVLIG
jgi:hypothetical protein